MVHNKQTNKIFCYTPSADFVLLIRMFGGPIYSVSLRITLQTNLDFSSGSKQININLKQLGFCCCRYIE